MRHGDLQRSRPIPEAAWRRPSQSFGVPTPKGPFPASGIWRYGTKVTGAAQQRQSKKSPRKKAFQIETKSLIDLRDWVDEQLELLGKKLQNLAVSKGFGLQFRFRSSPDNSALEEKSAMIPGLRSFPFHLGSDLVIDHLCRDSFCHTHCSSDG